MTLPERKIAKVFILLAPVVVVVVVFVVFVIFFRSRRSLSSSHAQAEITDRQLLITRALRKGRCFRMGWWGFA